ncbi:MAG: right-handed parallel beta-helix repeat-containing protein, partial [Candidatus Rokuibacteriota bacterium]
RDDEDKNITIRNNLVADVGRVGVRLTTFVYEADVGPSGIRGGQSGLVQDNVIDGAILAGIEMFSVDTVVERNTIRNIGLLAELTADGLGCELTGNNCAIHGNGVRLAVDNEVWSGHDNTLRLNRLEQIGWTGIDVRGPFNLIEHNVIVEPSVTLAEGAGIRTYDGNNFSITRAHDLTVSENVILDPVGEYHGMPPPRDRLWGYGINIDYSDAVEVTGNTVRGATAYGLIFTFARGSATGNTLWDNTNGPSGVAHLRLLDTSPNSTTRVALNGNAIYARLANRPLLSIEVLAHVTAADNNYYFNPFDNRLVRVSAISPIAMSLSSWQSTSGHDASSRETWFTLLGGQPDPSVLFVNDTDTPLNVPLAEPHFDLDQNVVAGSFTLDPFASRILIGGANVVFIDGFETGDTSQWTETVP